MAQQNEDGSIIEGVRLTILPGIFSLKMSYIANVRIRCRYRTDPAALSGKTFHVPVRDR